MEHTHVPTAVGAAGKRVVKMGLRVGNVGFA